MIKKYADFFAQHIYTVMFHKLPITIDEISRRCMAEIS